MDYPVVEATLAVLEVTLFPVLRRAGQACVERACSAVACCLTDCLLARSTIIITKDTQLPRQITVQLSLRISAWPTIPLAAEAAQHTLTVYTGRFPVFSSPNMGFHLCQRLFTRTMMMKRGMADLPRRAQVGRSSLLTLRIVLLQFSEEQVKKMTMEVVVVELQLRQLRLTES